MKTILSTLAVALALSGCTAPIAVQSGPLTPLSSAQAASVRIVTVEVSGAPSVLDRYAQTKADYGVYRPDSTLESEFSASVSSEVGHELRLCATGDRALGARVLIDALAYDGDVSSLWNGAGADAIAGVVELYDPAAPAEVLARYRVRASSNSGNAVVRMVSDRLDGLAEAFGRSLCMEAFGRNPRAHPIFNSTPG